MKDNQQILDKASNQNKNSVNDKLICEICGKECNKFYGLSSHVIKKHNISSKNYYDKYLKKENDGICLICKKETKFCRLSCGYYKHCSCKCSANNQKTQEKKKQTCLKNFGVDHPNKSKEIKDKYKHTCLKKYGEITNLKCKDTQYKIKQTNLKKYGVDHFSKSEMGREICRRTIKNIIEAGLKNPQTFSPNHGKNEDLVFNEIEKHILFKLLIDQERFGFWPDRIPEKEQLKIDFEFDEGDHKYQLEKDKERDRIFMKNGYTVLRIKESEWLDDKELQIIKVQETVKFLEQVKNLVSG